ncbi:MAG: hypothetical protein J6A77_07150 [Lachnospiraceae bacterium]|nr:hypothetical protein [Lachnospiraceae bacterium]
MKYVRNTIFVICMLCALVFQTGVEARAETGEGNIDGGGGEMGTGTKDSYWSNYKYGVRVTVVRTDGSIVSTPFDLASCDVSGSVVHFGRTSKIHYAEGQGLSPAGGSYSYSKPGEELPRIISSGKYQASIEAIKRYFCSEYAAQMVSDKTGIPYYELISGPYKVVLEPVAYFKFLGVDYAMTATEAALYNQMSDGKLRQKMSTLTHKNLPLALFLEKPELGYPAWTGSTTDKVSDTAIIDYLGIGIISYENLREIIIPETDYTYRVDTDVITSVTLHSDIEVNPDEPARVTFTIDGASYRVEDIVMPEGDSQLVWVKWHTPSSPGIININIRIDGAETGQTSFTARIEELNENVPPDPMATDSNPTYSRVTVPHNDQKSNAAWSVWSAVWEPKWEWEADWQWEYDWQWESDWQLETKEEWESNWEIVDGQWVDNGEWVEVEEWVDYGEWVDHGEWVDYGEWVDHGKYVFSSTYYNMSMQTSMEIHPDDIVPTAVGDTMKSGYGIKQFAWSRYFTNAEERDYVPTQNAVSYFPEFKYKTYWRLLKGSGGNPNYFTFQNNAFSTYNREVHFTPVWFPDSTYQVYTYILDAWTPVGMLAMNLTDSIEIEGSMYDDWYSKRE